MDIPEFPAYYLVVAIRCHVALNCRLSAVRLSPIRVGICARSNTFGAVAGLNSSQNVGRRRVRAAGEQLKNLLAFGRGVVRPRVVAFYGAVAHPARHTDGGETEVPSIS